MSSEDAGHRSRDEPPAQTQTMRPQDWDLRWAERLTEPIRDPNRFLVAEVEALPAGRALDLACGAGRNAVWLAERG